MKLTFQAQPVTLDAAAGEAEAPRTITGIAVPYDTPAVVMSGEKVLVRPGAFDTDSKPKLLESHDLTQLRGTVTELVDTDDALLFTASFARTRAADDAIELVKAGAYDAVSAGFTPTKYNYDKKGTLVVEKAEIHEISLVAIPAWKGAQITEIAASSPEDDEAQTTEPAPEEENTVDQNQQVEAVEAETIPTPVVYAQAKRDFRLPSAAEYIATMMRGGAEWANLQTSIRAAAPDVLTSDLDGILPLPIVQPVYNGLIGRRSVIDAIGARALPAGGKVFIRPSVTTHTSIAAVTENNNNIQSGTFVVTDNQVTKAQYGGYVEVSQFSIDTTQPEVIALLLDDMSRVYGEQTETAVETALEAAITATEPLTGSNTPAGWANFVWAATETILDQSSHLPTHLFVSPNYWAALGKLVDDAGRPLFPQVGPMNAFGNVAPGTVAGNAFGLSVVVCPYITDFVAVGNADGFEIFEDIRGALSVNVPNQLSRTIAWYGYLATLMIDADKFVKQGA
jgi:HK97 family phage prohead protease